MGEALVKLELEAYTAVLRAFAAQPMNWVRLHFVGHSLSPERAILGPIKRLRHMRDGVSGHYKQHSLRSCLADPGEAAF